MYFYWIWAFIVIDYNRWYGPISRSQWTNPFGGSYKSISAVELWLKRGGCEREYGNVVNWDRFGVVFFFNKVIIIYSDMNLSTYALIMLLMGMLPAASLSAAYIASSYCSISVAIALSMS